MSADGRRDLNRRLKGWAWLQKWLSGQRRALASLLLGKRLGNHCTGGLGGPQGRFGKSPPLRESIPPPPVDPVASRYTDYVVAAHRQSWTDGNYSGADKSLARPGRKQATFPTFYGTWRFITTFTTFHHLSLP